MASIGCGSPSIDSSFVTSDATASAAVATTASVVSSRISFAWFCSASGWVTTSASTETDSEISIEDCGVVLDFFDLDFFFDLDAGTIGSTGSVLNTSSELTDGSSK